MPNNQKPSFAHRLYAVVIDYCIILIYMSLLATIAWSVYLVTGRLPDWLKYGVTAAEVLGFVLLVVPVGLYLYFSESSARRATVGKRALHLVVTSNATQVSPNKRQIAIRTVIKLLPWELAHFFVWHTVAATRHGQTAFPLWLEVGLISCLAVPGVYLLSVALEPKGRGLHDFAAGTRVIATTS